MTAARHDRGSLTAAGRPPAAGLGDARFGPGAGVQDTAAAWSIHRRAVEQGVGRTIDRQTT